MVDCSEVFIGTDVSKDRHAIAVADGGRDGEVRFHGEIGSDDASVRRLVRKLERSGARLRFCYEAGPTGYGLVLAMASKCAYSLKLVSCHLLDIELGTWGCDASSRLRGSYATLRPFG